MNRTLIAALASFALTACGAGLETDGADALKGSGGGGTKRTKSTATTTTFATRTTDARVAGVEPTWKNSFEINATYDVYVALEIGGSFSGHHTATFELRMPDGSLYQTIEQPFATDVAAYPGEQQAEAISGGWRVWVSIPVAGTMIQQYALTGTWSASAFVDGSATANASSTFSLF